MSSARSVFVPQTYKEKPYHTRGKQGSSNLNNDSLGMEDVFLDSQGRGGITKGISMAEDLLHVVADDLFLLCVPYNEQNNEVHESYRRHCELNDYAYSTFTLGGYRRDYSGKATDGDYLQIPIQVVSNPNGNDIITGAISVEKAIGEKGIYVRFFKSSLEKAPEVIHKNNLILYKHILQGQFQLRHTHTTRSRPLQDFSPLFIGSSTKAVVRNNYGLLMQLLVESRGDPDLYVRIINDFLSVLNSWEKKQLKRQLETKKRAKEAAAHPSPFPATPKVTNPAVETVTPEECTEEAVPASSCEETRQQLVSGQDDELCASGPVYKMMQDFDADAKDFLTTFGSAWTSLSSDGILDTETLVENLKEQGPYTWMSAAVAKAPRSCVANKDGTMLLHIFSLLRERDTKFLSSLALIFSFAGMARGVSEVSQEVAKVLRVVADRSSAMKFMKVNEEKCRDNLTNLFRNEPTLSVAWDNYQRGQQKSEQNNMQSNVFTIATNAFIKREIVQVWPLGTVLTHKDGTKYEIRENIRKDPSHFWATYRALKMASAPTETCTAIITLPDFDYTVSYCPKLPPKPPIAHPTQQIPPPMGMVWSETEYTQKMSEACLMKIVHQFGTLNALGDHPLQEILAPIHSELFRMREEIHDEALAWKDPTKDAVSLFQFMEIMPCNETTEKGSSDVIFRILKAIGSLDEDDHGGIVTTPITEHRRLFVYGDQLTIKHVHTLADKLLKKAIETDDPESAEAFLRAVDTIYALLGDLHVDMHILAAIFLWVYGGYIQPIQATLGWTRIQRNTIPRNKQSSKLFILIHDKMNRYLFRTWAKTMTTASKIVLADESQPKKSVLLADLAKHDARTIIMTLVTSLASFMEEKRQSEDVVNRFFMQVLDQGKVYREYRRAVHSGDPYLCEILRKELLPFFAAMGKPNYVELFAAAMEIMYEKMSPPTLQEQRLNNFIRQSRNKGCIAMDAMCEIINLFTKRMANMEMDMLIRCSLYLALMQVCYKLQNEIIGNGNSTFNDSSKVQTELNSKIVTYLIDDCCEMLVNKKRTEMKDDFVWQHVPGAIEKFAVEAMSNRVPVRPASKAISRLFEDFAKKTPVASHEEVAREEAEYENDTESSAEGEEEGADNTNVEQNESQLLQRATKKISSTKKYPFHQLVEKNQSVIAVGRKKLKNLTANRKKAGRKRERLIERVREAAELHRQTTQLLLSAVENDENAPPLHLKLLKDCSDRQESKALVTSTLQSLVPAGRVPRPFQVDGSMHLASDGSGPLLVVVATGKGKSLLVPATSLLKGGVTIVFEPLLSVGGDQAASTRKVVPPQVRCYHLDTLANESIDALFKDVQSMRSRRDGCHIIYASPESFQKYSKWSGVISQLIKKGLLSAVVLDEAQKNKTERHYRPMDVLKEEIFDKIKSDSSIAVLFMSATVVPRTQKTLEQMYGVEFRKEIRGPMDRRIKLSMEVKPNVSSSTKAVKKFVSKQLEVPKRKIIIYEHSATKAEGLTDHIDDVCGEDHEAMCLTGKEGRVFKYYVTHAFCERNNRCRAIVSTSAGDCGVNCPDCGAVAMMGLPVSVTDHAQKTGRADRICEEAIVPYEARYFVCVSSYNYLFLQIENTEIEQETTGSKEDGCERASKRETPGSPGDNDDYDDSYLLCPLCLGAATRGKSHKTKSQLTEASKAGYAGATPA